MVATRGTDQSILVDPAQQACLLADVLRRAEWFHVACFMSERALRDDLAEPIKRQLHAERNLARAGIAARIVNADVHQKSGSGLGGARDLGEEERAVLLDLMIEEAALKLPCKQCGESHKPERMKPPYGSVDWWDDSTPYLGCGNCGAQLADLPSIYPHGW